MLGPGTGGGAGWIVGCMLRVDTKEAWMGGPREMASLMWACSTAVFTSRAMSPSGLHTSHGLDPGRRRHVRLRSPPSRDLSMKDLRHVDRL